MITSLFFLSVNVTKGLTHSIIYGFVKNSDGEALEGVNVKAYIGSQQEGSCNTNGNGYYTIDLGLLWGPTSVTLKFDAIEDHKDKTTSTTIDRAQTKRKDATLKQFFYLSNWWIF